MFFFLNPGGTASHKGVYETIKELRGRDFNITERVRGIVKAQARRRMIEKYLNNIPPTNSGRRVGVVRPVLEEWADRTHGRMSFHLTQIFAGHGCFGDYLCKIGKERTT